MYGAKDMKQDENDDSIIMELLMNEERCKKWWFEVVLMVMKICVCFFMCVCGVKIQLQKEFIEVENI